MTLVTRIESLLTLETGHLLEIFFDADSVFAGVTFDDLADNPRDRFTTSDLVAVSLLDMRFTPRAVRALLEEQSSDLSELLAQVRHDVDLWAASDYDLAAATALWRILRAGGALKGVGPTTTGKLLARKRPRLVPIVDSVVRNALALGDDSWAELRAALQQRGLPDRIEALRPAGVTHPVSTLRLLDAAVWMHHSQSRSAKSARHTVGL
jgi:hypothetical protein